MKFLLLFLAGFFFGPIGDYAHVATGTTGYPEGYAFYLLGLPWWVPFLFGSAALSIGTTHPLIDGLLRAPRSRPGSASPETAVTGVAAFIGLYILSGLLPWPAGSASDLVLATGAVAIWYFFERTWQGALLAASTAFAGTLVEILLVRNGVFFYHSHASNLFGVASWLPWLYVAASVGVGNLARWLNARQAG